MLLIYSTDPSPLVQAECVPGRSPIGATRLLTAPEDWQRAWETVRAVIRRDRTDRRT